MSKKFESVAIDVYYVIDLVRRKSGARSFAARIGEKLLARRLVDVNPGKKNFEP
ncbi:MAG TPA: hypothetical protein VFY61_11085 [Pyrinomonadaceae bacterium]|nr:hypothetical protein [Pyrinomonadaceae bacterium]